MIKKTIIKSFIFIVFVIAGILIWVSYQLDKNIPLLIEDTKDIYIGSCEGDEMCILIIEEYFGHCQNKNKIETVNYFDFEDKFLSFMSETHKCIEEKSQYKLPSFWDYFMERDINENKPL